MYKLFQIRFTQPDVKVGAVCGSVDLFPQSSDCLEPKVGSN